jgi:predicted 3-demethylubiquinone-9 3-methyltransferase (glyoxalase superfamily)
VLKVISVVALLIGGPDAAGAKRAMAAMMPMKKLDIAALEQAYHAISL